MKEGRIEVKEIGRYDTLSPDVLALALALNERLRAGYIGSVTAHCNGKEIARVEFRQTMKLAEIAERFR